MERSGGKPDAAIADRVEIRCDEAKELDRQGGETGCAMCWWHAWVTA